MFSRYLMGKHHSWYIGSVWHKDWHHQVYVGQWPIFYGPVILFHILIIWWRNVVLGIMDQCDTKIDLLKYMWVSDLYFMGHWFCLLSLTVIDLNYLYTLRNGAGQGYLCPPGICSSSFCLTYCLSTSQINQKIRKKNTSQLCLVS